MNDFVASLDPSYLKHRSFGYGHSFGALCHYYGREAGLELREDVETVLEPGMVLSMEVGTLYIIFLPTLLTYGCLRHPHAHPYGFESSHIWEIVLLQAFIWGFMPLLRKRSWPRTTIGSWNCFRTRNGTLYRGGYTVYHIFTHPANIFMCLRHPHAHPYGFGSSHIWELVLQQAFLWGFMPLLRTRSWPRTARGLWNCFRIRNGTLYRGGYTLYHIFTHPIQLTLQILVPKAPARSPFGFWVVA